MSGERMTSRADAELMKTVFDRAIRKLENYGFDRAQIGAAMAGSGFGIFAAHRGHEAGLTLLASQRKVLDQEFMAKN